MQIDFDFSEFEKFADNLVIDYELDTGFMTATQEIAKVLHSYLIELTPVKTGNLRKMWSAGDNLAFTVEKVEGGYEVTLINEAKNERGYHYGVDVNDGHPSRSGGWVVGRFFVDDAIDFTDEYYIEPMIARELQKWWRSV